MGGVPTPLPPVPPESLLDDIVLTHSLFLPTERFLQQLHQQYPGGSRGATRVGTRVGEEGLEDGHEEGTGVQ